MDSKKMCFICTKKMCFICTIYLYKAIVLICFECVYQTYGAHIFSFRIGLP